MNGRLEAIRLVGKKRRELPSQDLAQESLRFGAKVLSLETLEEVLPKKVFLNLKAVTEGKEKLDPLHAAPIAEAIKNWAILHGATHYTHWFQPLTGIQAEKHDSFLSLDKEGEPMEKFSKNDLLRGEPDASSLPSGGLRKTHMARGYTTWDPSTPIFLSEGSDGITLSIPALYFSWKGEALDHKIPLLRSDAKIHKSVLRLLKLAGVEASSVFSTLGPEQEYFAIDKNLCELRADLLLAGRTVFGARPPKGQELEDHYFGSVKDRILSFMKEFETKAVELGIPVKTRHNEVAPSQFEVAPTYEKASIAADHNLLLMRVMRETAEKHDLVVLFHEKPFAHFNGSGKHCNWSLATDTGLNLLDPKENSFLFLTLMTAILRAVWEHAGLLRASIGSSGNDYRLGGHEAPPTILSVSLGEALEKVIAEIQHLKHHDVKSVREIDLGLSHILPYEADASDRNRTSFFAFTGNKFEFRAVGASQHPAFPISVINAIVADSLSLILDEIANAIGDEKPSSQEHLLELALPVLKKHLLDARPILFGGDNYSSEWEREASQRGLPNIRKSFHAFHELLTPKSLRAFETILSEKEMQSRYEILVERYAKEMQIEANLMVELFRTQILPAALLDQKNRADSLKSLLDLGLPLETEQKGSLEMLAERIGQAIVAIDDIEKIQRQIADFGFEARAKVFAELGAPKMQEARECVDALERIVDNSLWPLPKYREILFHL